MAIPRRRGDPERRASLCRAPPISRGSRINLIRTKAEPVGGIDGIDTQVSVSRNSAICCSRLQRRRFCALSIPAIVGGCLRAEDNPAVSVRRVWTGQGANLFGGPSRDGRWLSFVDTESGDLAIRDLASGEKRRLTSNAGSRQFAYFSAISPDGSLVAYAWFNE